MKKFDLWKLSLLNVFSSPVRSALTVLGMAIGIGAILAVLTLGEAGKLQVRSEMTKLGIDKVWITAADGEALQQGDSKLMKESLQTGAAEVIYLTAKVDSSRKAETLQMIGCDPAYLQMIGLPIVEGRSLYPLEWGEDSRNAMLGSAAAQRLDVHAGDVICLEGIPFVVRTVLGASSVFSKVDTEMAVFVPVEAAASLTDGMIHELMLDVPSTMMPQTVALLAEGTMNNRRSTEVKTLTMQVQLDAADSVIGIFVEVLRWVAFICVVVGGVGVMNILLVSVRERRREIGIMKSLGTPKGQICGLFLLEALMYAALGGVLGILMGMGLVAMAGKNIGLQTAVRMQDCMLVFGVALMVGLFFGVAPAAKAAEMSCVEALRNED